VTDTILATEMREQPAVVQELLSSQRGVIADVARRARAQHLMWVLIAARGSSDNAARYAQHVFGRLCGLPVALASPSLSTLYDAPLRFEGALVIGISQSGQSPDVRSVLERAREQGRPTVAITNAPTSPLALVADGTVDIGAGAELSVAATKTYTASLAALAALAVELAGDDASREQLAGAPEAMQRQLELGIGDAARALEGADRCAVAGRGPNYATAFEAALKVKELSAIAAEPYSPADLMHGPVAVLGPASPLLAVAVEGPSLASVMDAVAEARSRGARCLLLSDSADARRSDGDARVPLTRVPEWLSPLVAVLPAQALAAQLAGALGVDVDAPFGLRKVTRTT
jgi:glucosamine--fructose-6-phosphate aminotransferase (isomerizing)